METMSNIILIVEDDFGLNELVSERVSESGYETYSAYSAIEAIEWLKSNNPLMMVLDYSLGDLMANEFIQDLLSQIGYVPPFVVATGRGDERIAVEMMKLGARDYIVKDNHFLEMIPLVVSKICKDIWNENTLKNTELALKKYQFLLEESQRITSTGTWELNLETNQLLWSDEIYRIFEIAPTEFGASYEAFLNAIHPDDRTMVDEAYRESLKSKQPYHIDHRLLMSDGRIKYVSEQCETTFDDTGSPLVSIGIVQDITKRKLAELALEQSQLEFKELFNNAPIGYHEIDMQGRIILMNQTELDLLGYSLDEILGKYIWDIIADSTYSREQTEKKLNSIFTGATSYERDFLCKDGFKVPVLLKDRQLFSETGIITGVRTSVQDITEIRNANTALLEKEVQYRAIADNGMALIWTAGTDKLCNYFNKPWLRFTGRTLEQEVGNGWTEGVHPDDFDLCMETYDTAFDKRVPFSMEYRIKHVSGEYRWLVDMGTPNYNSSNEFIGYIGHCFDIHERKSAEAELFINEEKFRAVFENSIVGKSITSFDGKLSVNKAFSDILGYSQDELSTMNWVDITHIDDVEENRKIVKSILDGERGSAHWEKRYIHKNGDVVWVDITATKLSGSNGIDGSLITEIYDITARKQAEDSLRTSEELYRNLVHRIPDGVYKSTSEGKFLEVNPAMVQMYGYDSKEELLKINIPVDLYCQEADRKVLLTNHKGEKISIFKQKKKDGSIIWVEDHGWLNRDESGTVISHEGVLRDITNRVNAEISLAESEKFFRQSQQAGKIGSYNLNVITGIWDSSEVLNEILGIDKNSEKSVEFWLDIIAPEDREMMNVYFKEYVIGQRKPFNKEYRIQRKSDGAIRWVFGRGELLTDKNTVVSMIGTIQDISERKEVEIQLDEKMADLMRFHKLTVGREMVMIDLKKEINQLLIKLGDNPKYTIVE
jgi:PAS domain S-box-containing protein